MQYLESARQPQGQGGSPFGVAGRGGSSWGARLSCTSWALAVVLCDAAALACRDFARDVLHLSRLHAFVRPENEPSRRVAGNIGMHVDRTLVRGVGDFLHEIWAVDLPPPKYKMRSPISRSRPSGPAGPL